jgi:hypothetical protein
MKKIRRLLAIVALSLAGAPLAQPSRADDGERLVRVDHYVGVRSTVPAIAGQMTSIYVREVVRVGTALRDDNNRVVLFIHGAGTPGEVSFDGRTRITAGWSFWRVRASTCSPWT